MEQSLSYKTRFFNIVTTSRSAFCQWWKGACMPWPLKSAAVEVTHCHHSHCQNAPPTTSLCSHPLVGLHKCSASVNECQWVSSFLHGGIQWHTFASSAVQCQTQFCQTALLLPSVTQQQNVMEHWGEGSASTAIPPTSASDVVGQCNRTGAVTFRAALVYISETYQKFPFTPAVTILIHFGVLNSRMVSKNLAEIAGCCFLWWWWFFYFFFHFKENILGKKCFVANIMHTAHGVCSKENLFKQEASKHSSKTLNVLLNSKQSRNEGRKIDMKGKAVNVMSLLQKLFLILACNLDVNLFCTAHFIYIFSHYLFISWFEVWSGFNGSEKEDLAWNKDVILRGSVRL